MTRPGTARLACVLVSLTVLGTATSAAATAAEPLPTAPEPTGKVVTITVREVGGRLKFVGPATVTAGDELVIVNRTNPLMVGPVTFSLVRPGYLPKTKAARDACFSPGHICWAIAEWQGTGSDGAPTINPAEAGEPGWDTMGAPGVPGDSWFSGLKPGTSFGQEVTAKPGTRLWFMDAIHPALRGTIRVLAPKQ
jgi:hypothetical protein